MNTTGTQPTRANCQHDEILEVGGGGYFQCQNRRCNTIFAGNPHDHTTDLRPFLSHPDAFVRSCADWALEFRGEGTRGLLPSEFAAARFEADMNNRLLALSRAGLDSSPAYTIA